MKRIDAVAPMDEVWSRDPETGAMDWRPVLDAYSNRYDERVAVEVQNTDGTTQTILSNRIHPFFVQREGEAPVSSEGHVYNGPIANGAWVDAADLHPGDRLLTSEAKWAEVASVEVTETPFEAYNLTVEGFHTYFVAGNDNQTSVSVWVHNNCAWLLPGYSQSSLQHAYSRHGSDFGFGGNWNKNSGQSFINTLESFKNASGTMSKPGTYRGNIQGTHYFDSSNNRWAFYDSNGNFVAAWKLSPAQARNLTGNGNVQ